MKGIPFLSCICFTRIQESPFFKALQDRYQLGLGHVDLTEDIVNAGRLKRGSPETSKPSHLYPLGDYSVVPRSSQANGAERAFQAWTGAARTSGIRPAHLTPHYHEMVRQASKVLDLNRLTTRPSSTTMGLSPPVKSGSFVNIIPMGIPQFQR